ARRGGRGRETARRGGRLRIGRGGGRGRGGIRVRAQVPGGIRGAHPVGVAGARRKTRGVEGCSGDSADLGGRGSARALVGLDEVSGDPDLVSCPTRRSSDLARRGGRGRETARRGGRLRIGRGGGRGRGDIRVRAQVPGGIRGAHPVAVAGARR